MKVLSTQKNNQKTPTCSGCFRLTFNTKHTKMLWSNVSPWTAAASVHSQAMRFKVHRMISLTWKRATGFNSRFNIWFTGFSSTQGSPNDFTHMETSNRLQLTVLGFNIWFPSHGNEQLASIPGSASGFTRMEMSNWLQFQVQHLVSLTWKQATGFNSRFQALVCPHVNENPASIQK